MLLGYNTNGFAHHRLEDACEILAELGYRSVAVTVERDLLDPPDRTGVARAADRLKAIIASTGLRITIETGSRYILDPRRKHQPTLLDAEPSRRAKRVEFLKACLDLGAAVGGDSVSLWSGASVGAAGDHKVLWTRLTDGLRDLLDHARAVGTRMAFEPEPGMFIDTMDRFESLEREIDDPLFGLTLDVGHVHCLADGNPADHIRRRRSRLWNVHVEDMRRGRHEHLMFGDGEMDFPPIFAALAEIAYDGPIHVELSRHGHDAVTSATRAMSFLRGFLGTAPR